VDATRSIALLFVILSVGSSPAAAQRKVAYSIRTMGTQGTVTIVTGDSLASLPAARAAHGEWLRVDSLMSNWTRTSEVARINRDAAAESLAIDPEVGRVIETALRIHGESRGAFDITIEPVVRLWGFLGGSPRVPADEEIRRALALTGAERVEFDPPDRVFFRKEGVRIDLGGIAKGYGVDRAAASLRENGVTCALVDLSGNMTALGSPPGREAWVVGVRDPRDRIPSLVRLELPGGGSIATSGNYEIFLSHGGKTYGHILDPRTGWPAEGLISATVLAPSAMEADAWATAFIVLGPDEAKSLASGRADLSGIFIEPGQPGDVIWVETVLRGTVEIEPAAEGVARIVFF